MTKRELERTKSTDPLAVATSAVVQRIAEEASRRERAAAEAKREKDEKDRAFNERMRKVLEKGEEIMKEGITRQGALHATLGEECSVANLESRLKKEALRREYERHVIRSRKAEDEYVRAPIEFPQRHASPSMEARSNAHAEANLRQEQPQSLGGDLKSPILSASGGFNTNRARQGLTMRRQRDIAFGRSRQKSPNLLRSKISGARERDQQLEFSNVEMSDAQPEADCDVSATPALAKSSLKSLGKKQPSPGHAPESPVEIKYYTALHSFKAEKPLDMKLVPGDVIEVLQESEDGWWYGKNLHQGMKGYFPCTFCQPVEGTETQASRGGRKSAACEGRQNSRAEGKRSTTPSEEQRSAKHDFVDSSNLAKGAEGSLPLGSPRFPDIDPLGLMRNPRQAFAKKALVEDQHREAELFRAQIDGLSSPSERGEESKVRGIISVEKKGAEGVDLSRSSQEPEGIEDSTRSARNLVSSQIMVPRESRPDPDTDSQETAAEPTSEEVAQYGSKSTLEECSSHFEQGETVFIRQAEDSALWFEGSVIRENMDGTLDVSFSSGEEILKFVPRALVKLPTLSTSQNRERRRKYSGNLFTEGLVETKADRLRTKSVSHFTYADDVDMQAEMDFSPGTEHEEDISDIVQACPEQRGPNEAKSAEENEWDEEKAQRKRREIRRGSGVNYLDVLSGIIHSKSDDEEVGSDEEDGSSFLPPIVPRADLPEGAVLDFDVSLSPINSKHAQVTAQVSEVSGQLSDDDQGFLDL